MIKAKLKLTSNVAELECDTVFSDKKDLAKLQAYAE